MQVQLAHQTAGILPQLLRSIADLDEVLQSGGLALAVFRRRTQARFRLQLLDSRDQLLAYLQQSVQPADAAWWDPGGWFRRRLPVAALSLLGADALDRAIAAGWLAPLPASLLGERWQNLDPRWQAAALREGQIWGVPWRT